MGRPDQLIKRIFREETAAATRERVRFEVPPEIPTGALTPDGRLTRVVAPEEVAKLPPPWCHLKVEAVTDFKMPGDHSGRSALARGELRRHARWVTLLEGAEQAGGPEAADVLDTRDVATWLVTAHRPRWLAAEEKRGAITIEPAGAGCLRLGPRDHDVLWIVANELPLSPELLPFLIARSGRALIEFVKWVETVRSPEWLTGVLQELPMAAAEAYEDLHYPADAEEQRRIHAEVLRRWLRLTPEGGDEVRKEGVREGVQQSMRQLFELRLGRPLADAEQAVLRHRVVKFGDKRVCQAALELDADALAAWLADPAAR